MKELVALLLGIGLITAGWEKSYKEHYIYIATMLSTGGPAAATPARYFPPARPVHSDSAWMWRKSTLDSTKQSGVDRSGVHTTEPMLHQ